MEQLNRTLICSVVFSDMVGYSARTNTDQVRLKEWFTGVISRAIDNVAVNDRMMLDTGDGMVISFLGNPEDALFVSLALADLFEQAPPELRSDGVRLGIHLGPVKLVRDINGQPNMLGDGINVAQRIMSFAKPGEVLVSRQFYEVVSRLSDAYVKQFSYEGTRQDKHVREHEIYLARRIAPPAPDPSGAPGPAVPPLAMELGLKNHRAEVPQPPAGSNGLRRLWPWSAVAALLIATVLIWRPGGAPPSAPAAPTLPGSVSGDSPLPAIQVATPAGTPPPAAAQASAPAPLQTAHSPSGDAASPSAPPTSAPQQQEPAAKTQPADATGTPVTQPSGRNTVGATAGTPNPVNQGNPVKPMGAVFLAISPWGEVKVNGVSKGVSPPLKSLQLEPGNHTIEVVNTQFPSYTTRVTVRAGEKVAIRHAF